MRYPCTECDFQARRPPDLKHHIEVKHRGLGFPCTICSYKATTKRHLRTHIESQHMGVRYNCDMCDYSSTRKETLQGHIDATHKNRMISICLRKDILQMPLFLKAKENQMNGSDLDGSRLKRKLDKYNCQICDFVERKKVKLIKHMSNVHNETSFYCEHCGQKYKNRNDMKKHVLEVHEGKGFPCAQWKDKLNVHKHFTANIYLREMKLPCQYMWAFPEFKFKFKFYYITYEQLI